ncbi:MAG: hypothetical protein HUJ56_11930, partial [Erysipelotrichaceae bacterium]|nr:hypothetical protein [Erysipelotrichaceae bacterium]
FILDIGCGGGVNVKCFANSISAEGKVVETAAGDTIATLTIDPEISIDGAIYPQLEGVEIHGGSDSYVYEDIHIPYAYYAPTDGAKHPLILWNHGVGERGEDPKIDVLANEVTALWGSEFQAVMGGCYVVAAQVPTSDPGKADRAKGTIQLIKDLAAADPNIDLDRIYVAGCSMGGGNTIAQIKADPEFFAAAVPICPAGTITAEEAKDLADLPIWFVHSEDDSTVAFSGTQEKMANLEAAGNTQVHLSSFDHVWDNTGRFTAEDGGKYMYNGHWSWVYFDNNECVDDNDSTLNLWSWLANQVKPEYASQTVVVTADDWGPAVSKTIIEFENELTAADVDVSNIKVTESKTGWSESGIDTAPRTVEAAYLCDKDGNEVTTDSKYVAIEMYISPSEGGAFKFDLASFANSWCATYQLDVEGVGSAVIHKNISLPEDAIIPALEGVELNGGENSYFFTAEDGEVVQVPYAYYAPTDGAKHPIMIWNHGAGERGTDPDIAVLANQVSNFWGDEFQTIMGGGCYVVAPQVPTDASWAENSATNRAEA